MQRQNHPINLNDDEKILFNRILDLSRQAAEKGSPRFSNFLDQRQQSIAVYAANTARCDDFTFFGGNSDAERKVVGFGDFGGDSGRFPITPISVSFRKQDKLSHRDFLGALMNLMIKREIIGDIIIGEGVGVMYVISSAAPMIISELKKVGRVGVSCQQGMAEDLLAEQKFLDVNGSVSSLRLDCIVSHLINTSRSESDKLILSGKVAVNSQFITDGSKATSLGDIISIRGHGKFVFDDIGSKNKKGKIKIYCKKYS